MDAAHAAAVPWLILLSGLGAVAIGAVFLLLPDLAAQVLRPWASPQAADPRAVRRMAWGLVGVGLAWLLVFAVEVYPFPRARPFWLMAASTLLLPLAPLAFIALVVTTFLARRPR